MDVVARNFLRLLRTGVFTDTEPIEPMSEWKWNRLWQIALMHGVAGLVADGIRKRDREFLMNMSAAQRAQWDNVLTTIEERNRTLNTRVEEILSVFTEEKLRPILMKGQAMATLYPNPLHRMAGDCDIFFPFATQAKKANLWARNNAAEYEMVDRFLMRYEYEGMRVEHHRKMQRLANVVLNTKLQSIINTEIGSCDSTYITIGATRVETLPPALNMLGMIVRIARYLLNEGISIKQLVDMGLFLRVMGDKVDFVRLQKWIDGVGLSDIARLEGALLVGLLGFTPDELPFMTGKRRDDIAPVTHDMFTVDTSHPDDWFANQGNKVFIRVSGNKEVNWRLAHTRKYFGYCPSEAISNVFASIAQSLSHIEE